MMNVFTIRQQFVIESQQSFYFVGKFFKLLTDSGDFKGWILSDLRSKYFFDFGEMGQDVMMEDQMLLMIFVFDLLDFVFEKKISF